MLLKHYKLDPTKINEINTKIGECLVDPQILEFIEKLYTIYADIIFTSRLTTKEEAVLDNAVKHMDHIINKVGLHGLISKDYRKYYYNYITSDVHHKWCNEGSDWVQSKLLTKGVNTEFFFKIFNRTLQKCSWYNK